MSCQYCNENKGHLSRCPLYTPFESIDKCDICHYPILSGEEYIRNESGDYIHRDCVSNIDWLVRWLGGTIGEYNPD